MTRDETKKIIMAIVAFFPNWDPTRNGGNLSATVTAWYIVMSDFPYQPIEAALKAYVRVNKSGFAPSPGQLIDLMYEIAHDDDLSDMEAWRMVTRAVSNSIYNAEAEFAKLPPSIKKAVGGADVLREWATTTDVSSFQTVIQSNFLRSYRTVKAREAEDRAIPVEVRQLIKDTIAQLEAKPGLNHVETKPEPIPEPDLAKLEAKWHLD